MEQWEGDRSNTRFIRFFLLDACSLVKMVLDESGPGTQHVRRLVGDLSHISFTTWLSVGECFGILKRKRNARTNPLPLESYHKAASLLTSYVKLPDVKRPAAAGTIQLVEFNLAGLHVGIEVLDLMRRFEELDFADALQLLAMTRGSVSDYIGPSRTTLVTMDGPLKQAAAALGLLVYDPDHDGYPPPPIPGPQAADFS